MTDNIFEIETTALAHVACAPLESGVLLTDFAAAYPSVNHSWIFSVIEHTGLPSHTWNVREQNEDNSLWQEEYDKVVLRVASFLQWHSTRSSDGNYPMEP